jgi:hypothetical protein
MTVLRLLKRQADSGARTIAWSPPRDIALTRG